MIKLEEVAQLAGVSTSTAYLALNDKRGVNAQTRQRVIEIAQTHNYQPLRQRKQLNSKDVIRLVVCNSGTAIDDLYLQYPIIDALFTNLKATYRDTNTKVIITTVIIDNIVTQLNILEQQLTSQTLMILGTGLSSRQVEEINKSFPQALFFDVDYPELASNNITINNYLGGIVAAEYLINHNHSNIGYIMGELRIKNSQERFRGFSDKLGANGLMINPDYILNSKNMTIENEILNFKITNVKTIPTAFFCENDYIALSAIKYFTALGLRVPHDVSILGFDGLSVYQELDYNISSVLFDIGEITSAVTALRTLNLSGYKFTITPRLIELGTVKKR